MAWVLLSKCGSQEGVHWDITEGPVVLGQGEERGVVVNDPDAEPPQCHLFVQGDRVYVETLGDSNTLQVNGENVRRASLGPGDTITIGQATFTISRCANAREAPAARMVDYALGNGNGAPWTRPPNHSTTEEATAYATAVKNAARARQPMANGQRPTESPLLGDSQAMQDVRALIRQVAPIPLAVLITGETGTGKELAAEMLHTCSQRANGPFIAVNCAAIPEHLFESELFGHEKGAFTGADRKRKGKIALAHNGTLFLDEIGELSKENQARLLRVLEKGVYYPVGAETESYSNFRILAATNRNLQRAMEEGTFRQDLYHRICAMEIYIPPLRERPSDIRTLAQYFSTQAAQELGREWIEFGEEILERLQEHAWPGNVRELKNSLQRVTALARDELLPLAALALTPTAHKLECTFDFPLKATLNEVEHRHIARVLDECGGNISKAARMLGVHRNTLHNKIGDRGDDSRIISQNLG